MIYNFIPSLLCYTLFIQDEYNPAKGLKQSSNGLETLTGFSALHNSDQSYGNRSQSTGQLLPKDEVLDNGRVVEALRLLHRYKFRVFPQGRRHN